jgi:hypothetical protein
MTEPVFGLSFAGGINQSDQVEQLDPASSFALLQNVRQPHRGAASKRNGYSSLGATRLDSTTRTEGRRLFTNGDQVCTVDGQRIDVYAPSLSCFVPRSRVPEADFSSFEVPSFGLDLSVPTYVADVTYVNGYIVVALIASGTSGTRSCLVSVIDAATKAVVRGPELLFTSTVNLEVGLASFGTRCVLGSNNPSLAQVFLYTLDTASAATVESGWSAAVGLGAATGTDGQLAMASMPTATDRIAVAYVIGSGTNRLVVKTYGASGVIETVTIDTGGVTPDLDTVDLSDQGETLWVCWAIAGTAYVVGLNPTDIDGTMYATKHAGGIVAGIDGLWISTAGASQAMLSASYTVTSTSGVMVRRIAIVGGEAVGESPGASSYENAHFVGRSFLKGDRVYQWVSSDNSDDLTLCDITRSIGGDDFPHYLRPVVAPIVRGLRSSFLFHRCRTVSTGANTFAFAFPVKATGTSASAMAIEIDFASSQRWSAVEYHRSTYLSGGVVTFFDGSTITESGFLCAPPLLGIDTATAGTLTLTNGGRRYVAVYVSPDADGNLSISGVSTPTEPTGNCVSKKVTIGLRPLSITMRGAKSSRDRGPGIQIHVYATTDGGEEPYHLIKSIDNDPQTSLLTITDELDETTVASGALLYGSGNLPGTLQGGQPGGPQDHRSPPGLRSLVAYNGMLVGATDYQIWHTSQPVYGEAPWWSPVFTQQIDGTITALFVQDGALYATTRDGVYSNSGDPPNDAGTSGGLSLPRKLAVERGCINARSVCVTSGGTFYQSNRGYELFRSGGITPVGDLVQDTLAEFPNVTSAVFDAQHGLVRIALAKTLDSDGLVDSTDGGRDLIFDVILGVWVSVDRKQGSTADQASQDAMMATIDGEPLYVWLAADGTLYREASDYLDSSAWVAMQAETGWIRIAGMQGEQFIDRILLLARSLTAHDLTIELAFDYSDTYTATRTFTAAQIASLTREWLDAEVNPTTSQAVRVRVTDATPSTGSVGTGEGGKWIDLTFNGQPHRGAKRTAGAQRSG